VPRQTITASRRIQAPAPVVYDVIANYRDHHPRILPAAFSNFAVSEGGIGAGTRFTFDLRVGGRTRHYDAVVREPEPGRRLVEDYPAEGSSTSFLVEPAGAAACTVTFVTAWDARGGLAGVLERWIAGRLLGPVYEDELSRLDEYARRVAAASQPSLE
jgi:hypothetical protein